MFKIKWHWSTASEEESHEISTKSSTRQLTEVYKPETFIAATRLLRTQCRIWYHFPTGGLDLCQHGFEFWLTSWDEDEVEEMDDDDYDDDCNDDDFVVVDDNDVI